MTVTFWFWLLLSGLALIVGIVIIALIFGLANVKDLLTIKKKLPKDKKLLSQYIKDNGEFFKSSNTPIKTRKEVEEDEYRKSLKFREFEKLRRMEETNSGIRGKRPDNSPVKGNTELQGRNIFPNESSSINPSFRPNSQSSRRTIKLDD